MGFIQTILCVHASLVWIYVFTIKHTTNEHKIKPSMHLLFWKIHNSMNRIHTFCWYIVITTKSLSSFALENKYNNCSAFNGLQTHLSKRMNMRKRTEGNYLQNSALLGFLQGGQNLDPKGVYLYLRLARISRWKP